MASRYFLQEEARPLRERERSAFKLIYGWQLKPSQPRENAARAIRVFFRYKKTGASKRVLVTPMRPLNCMPRLSPRKVKWGVWGLGKGQHVLLGAAFHLPCPRCVPPFLPIPSVSICAPTRPVCLRSHTSVVMQFASTMPWRA